ncbi:propionyl-CoA synthetase [Halioglobus japonicus]|uniref:Propionyl-CoA synthetase n=1 Tax=Halioglobus japonicus TaxID=930805 RepID=A0AAP8SNG1_9GAMM|nr:propionyl-CoA synthetase [Halioglobus japonicus]AQA18586.1 propionyl-CoA synthetase [Halioglobus japonicus]PLW86610.1 propionyl-CoA synthetase [Halioglobus japonicus]GHD11989.1 propionyl-CoA synthetase [Halioglobus japonicus]
MDNLDRWREAAQAVHWFKTPQQVLDDSEPPFYRWFPDGQTNACYNALDVHVAEGRGEQTALIYDSPVTDTCRRYTYTQLLDQVARFAGVLADHGVGRGDRVIVYMPMVPEALIAMLACARLGAVHSVVFGGFASNELAVRIDDATPKLIVSASCGVEPNRIVAYKPLLDAAIELAQHKPDNCVILQRPMQPAELIAGRDVDWTQAMADARAVPCTPVAANDPLYVLYTSGTTGQPKGVVRDTGGSIVALKWSMKAIYDVEPGDVYWAASDVGWVVGHSYIVYGPLFSGCATVIYEGKPVGTPDPGAFWRVIEDYQVKVLFTAPTAFRAIKKEDPAGKYLQQYNVSSLRSLFLAGERCDPSTLAWAQQQLKVPVIDHWWQTETGWPICANCLGIEALPIVPGSPARPVPGYYVQVLDGNGEQVSAGEIGALVVKSPLPPGTFTTLWQAEERYQSAYFARYPGYYETGDAGYIDANGYVFVMARTDDVINVAGHRLSTGAMEEVLAEHPDVAECAVVGVADPMKGQLPLGLLVLNAGAERATADVVRESLQLVRDKIGPVAAFKLCTVVERLPKTRSGKILRGTMRSIADGEPWKMPATIDDPVILDEITEALRTLGYAA